jgi:hypothetical protein
MNRVSTSRRSGAGSAFWRTARSGMVSGGVVDGKKVSLPTRRASTGAGHDFDYGTYAYAATGPLVMSACAMIPHE